MLLRVLGVIALILPAAGANLRCAAATRPDSTEETSRLASPEEGSAIVQAAWELRKGWEAKPDCSHFVNAVYSQVGLDYDYAQSSAVYDGVVPFELVHQEQPGDLVVWKGHIGIVVDPKAHSYYSSVLTGFAIDDYRSGYWANRGRPRFFRYIVDDAHRARLQAHLQAMRAGPNTGAAGTESKSDPQASAARAATGSPESNADVEVYDAVLVTRRPKPSKDELLAALVRSSDSYRDRLLQNPWPVSQALVAVAGGLTIEELNFHDRTGWAELKVEPAALIHGGRVDVTQEAATQRLNLRRDDQGWTVLVPQNYVYLPRELAIKVLANHLAAMSHASPEAPELKKVVEALDGLLGGKSNNGRNAGPQ